MVSGAEAAVLNQAAGSDVNRQRSGAAAAAGMGWVWGSVRNGNSGSYFFDLHRACLGRFPHCLQLSPGQDSSLSEVVKKKKKIKTLGSGQIQTRSLMNRPAGTLIEIKVSFYRLSY